MKNLIPCDKPRIAALADRLKRVGNRAQYQRIQCVLIRATTVGSSPAQIAQLLGWSIASVHLIHSRWVKEGDALLDLHGRTARRHQHLSPTQEAGLLAPFAAKAQAGGLLHVSEITKSLDAKLSRVAACD